MTDMPERQTPISERLTHVRRGGIRLFASPRDEPRSRRASDFVSLAVATAAVVALGVVAIPPSRFESTLVNVANATPTFIEVIWKTSSNVLAVWAVVIVGAALVRRRVAVARDAVLAAALGLGYAVVTFRLVDGSWPDVLTALAAQSPPNQLPSLRLALCSAVVMTAAPHLSRPFRRWGRWTEGLAAISLVALAVTSPIGALMSLFVATAAAATIHLLFGSSAGRPGLSEVAAALEELGVDAHQLQAADRQAAGVFTVSAIDGSGDRLTTKIYGRDARDTQLLAKAWRALWYRSADTITLTRVQQVEHEAFMTLLAKNAGVAVPEIVTAGRTVRRDAVLVLRDDSTPLGLVEPSVIDDDLMLRTWEVVDRLHLADLTHGNLSPLTLALGDDGRVLVTGLGGAMVAPTDDQRRTDLAQVLVTSVVLIGSDRALALARSKLGADGLATLLPYVQSAALGPDLRRATRRASLDIDDLRKQAAEAAGTDAPEMAKLRRVTLRNVLMVAVFVFAAYAIISALSGVDVNELRQELQGATWGWIVLGLFFGQVPRFAQAIGTRGASPVPLTYGPVVALQFTVCFIGLAVPTAAGRIAIEIRFFQRQGVPPAAAVSVGAIDSFGGFLVQMLILGTVLLFGSGKTLQNLDFDTSGATGKLLTVLAVALVLVVLAIIVFLVVPSLRRWLWARVHPWITQILDTLRGVRSPARFLQILGGNLLAEILFATTMAMFLEAFGVRLGLGTLLVINVLVSLFAGIMPIPGGIGVSEGALIALLVAAGVNETVAFAAVSMYRLATFYIPVMIGSLTFRWLERNRYL